MKKLLVSCLGVLTLCQIALAQDPLDRRAEIKEQRNAIIRERQDRIELASKVSGGEAAVTSLDVGEPDSFGKSALFLGIATGGIILIDPTCDPNDVGPLGPDDHCIAVPDPSIPVPGTTFNNIGRITVPGKSVGNVIYAIANHTVSFSAFNPNPNPTQARISYVASITIESEALNDPSLIDPTTGLPFNGSYTTSGLGTYISNKTLASAASDFQTQSYSRANTGGLSRTFFAALGLPNSVIDQIYKKPVTIKLNVQISSRWVDSATILYSIRFLGN